MMLLGGAASLGLILCIPTFFPAVTRKEHRDHELPIAPQNKYSAPTNASKTEVPDREPRLAANALGGSRAGDAPKVPHVPVGAKSRTNRHPSQGESVLTLSAAPAENVELDWSVVGRRFPRSDLVEAECRTYWEGRESGEPRYCAEHRALLAQLESEPREEPWASQTEQKLRGYVNAFAGQYTIKALECRSSVCATECASPYGMLNMPSYEFSREAALLPRLALTARENQLDGTQTTITLRAFVRAR